jgi:hypothetical protein
LRLFPAALNVFPISSRNKYRLLCFGIQYHGRCIVHSATEIEFLSSSLQECRKTMWSIAKSVFAISILTSIIPACAAQSDPPAQQEDKRSPQTSGKEAGKAVDKAPSPPAGAGGLVVFVDPVTGQLVQPSAEDIGKLVGPPAPQVAPKAPLTFIYGPGNTVGITLPPELFSYAVATITPEGKLTLDCVVGDQTAAGRIAGGQSPRNGETPKAKGSPDEKH